MIEEYIDRVIIGEFLGNSKDDLKRALTEQMCKKDIPLNVCIIAYNKGFRCNRLKEMVEAFPVLAYHLMNIRNNIIDLLDPLRQGGYCCRDMGGSFSIKSILPAMFSTNHELDYHNLEGVHNGGEAMSRYPRIKDMTPEEQQTARHKLLKYCELDTYAMVKMWCKLL